MFGWRSSSEREQWNEDTRIRHGHKHSFMCLPAGSELRDSAFGYFITACVVIVLAIASYSALGKMVRMRPAARLWMKWEMVQGEDSGFWYREHSTVQVLASGYSGQLVNLWERLHRVFDLAWREKVYPGPLLVLSVSSTFVLNSLSLQKLNLSPFLLEGIFPASRGE